MMSSSVEIEVDTCLIMENNNLASKYYHDGRYGMNVFGQPHDESKSLRVQGSLALQASSLLTTKQFIRLHYSIIHQDKTIA